MGLAVDAPTPPDLTNRPLPSAIDPADVLDSTGDLRREELEQALRDGAWDDAFEDWTEDTDLNESEYRAILDAGLIETLDFYWDPYDGGVEFELPSVSERLADRSKLAGLAESELTDLGEAVTKRLDDGALDWDEAALDEE